MGGVKTFDAVTAFTKVNMMDPKQVGYQDSIDIIHEELHKTRKSFVKIGWYLKHINEEKMYAEDGYSNIYEFAHEKFNISQPTATRFINLCNEFSVGHDSPELDERYFDFSVSQLFEMLPMKPEEREQITSDMPVQEIREIKKENKSLNEPKDAEIKLFYNYELKHISTNNRKNLKSYLLENYKNRDGADNTFYFRCTPRGITINDSDEITWTRLVNRINELFPMEDKESEAEEDADDNIPGQTSIENDFPEYMPDTDTSEKTLPEEKYATSHKQEVDEQEIIDGEYREIEKSQVEVVPELEDAEEECVIKPEQPELPVFKNNEQRKAWLEDVEAWGLWYEDENIQAKYYKYNFPDGSRLIAVKYRYTCPPWMKDEKNAALDGTYKDVHYHMIYSEEYKKNHKYEYENYYTHSTVSITTLIDFIKEIAKQGK